MNDIRNNDPMDNQSNGSNNEFPPYLKFKGLLFYDVIYEVIKPTILTTNEEKIHFTLPKEHVHFIFNRHRYNYQLQIRICQLENKVTSLNGVVDYFPQGLSIHVGTLPCKLPFYKYKLGNTSSRLFGAPIDCTKIVKFTPNTINTISIKYTPDTKTYALTMCIVSKLTAKTLVNRLFGKARRNKQETINDILKLFEKNNDTDLAITRFKLPLICPITKLRMKVPVKSNQCKHIECFDALAYICSNRRNTIWKCPICHLDCLYNNLEIDSYIFFLLNHPSLRNCKFLIIL
uniref:E3 SUMO-protein ligase n=1 Tax=Schizaphis graminum TaxID=13262 RepID=A0A2S2PP54_SCHGA